MASQNDFNNLIVRPIWPPKNGNNKTVKASKFQLKGEIISLNIKATEKNIPLHSWSANYNGNKM